MDMNAGATEIEVAERMRFDSFKLGSANSSNHNVKPNHRHARSRSRNLSVSSSISLPFTSSTSTNKSVPETSPVSPSFPPTSSGTSSKRNSHHRRRSSVSTRHESADMMGVAVTDLPLSLSDDNINLGDKDSVRRRALWALEGKSDDLSYSKVEIPDISTPEINKKFELPSKPSFPPSFGPGLSNGAGKRDSFGKHLAASASAKELLHTLVEEDEEEEGDDSMVTSSPVEMSPAENPIRAPVIDVASTPTPSTRPRPAGLNLRPLSLNKENIVNSASLPTPVTPAQRAGLRSLTLASFPNFSSTTQNMNDDVTSMRRSSLTVTSASPTAVHLPRRPSLNIEPEISFDSPDVITDSAKRRASISYRCSTDHAFAQFALPTPELTPTLERHRSIPSVGSALNERPLSETEQHFLYQAHATLTQRITDLERALAASRPHSRSVSCVSDVSSSAPEEPSDEMLQLIADLKAERDELSKDVEGWRMRVADLEKQIGVLARRVDLERREAWVARERSSLLEVEKQGLEKSLEAKKVELHAASASYEAVRTERDAMKYECERLREQLESKREVEDECEQLRAALAEEKQKREQLEAERLSTTPTHAKIANYQYPPAYARRGLQFQSIDSEATEVELVEDFQTSLKSVIEEQEDFSDEEDNELSRYEEEDGDDYIFQSNRGSSVGSFEDIIDSAPEPVQGHHRRTSSSVKSWTFPQGARATPPVVREVEVDKFFGCLDYDETATNDHAGDNGRSLFSKGLLESDDDDFPPFLLPTHVGVEVPEAKLVLEAVMEEDEEEEEENSEDEVEDFVGEEVAGGIVFKFTPPEDSDASSSELHTPSPGPEKQRTHVFDLSEDDDEDCLFRFPQMTAPITPPPKPSTVHTPVKSASPVTPSSIPRSVYLKNYTPTATPERSVIKQNPPVNNFVTPPTKRGGTMPTFIPQPRASPVAKHAMPTSIRQPQRASTLPVMAKLAPAPSTNARSLAHRYDDSVPSVNVVQSPAGASKLSFQSFTNFIPSAFSWPGSPKSVPQTPDVPVREPEAVPRLSYNGRSVQERCYVSKQSQLEKLRSRLEEEQKMRTSAHGL